MKIICLQAENVKKIVAIEIRPDGNMVPITGKNGSGKSSTLDAIFWAISGARHIQTQPIRKGANHARIKLDMGELVVTRTFHREKEGESYTTKLEVAGAVKGTPQQMLDSLLDSLAFDPLKFARMDAKDQFDALKKYVPDVDFDKIAGANSIDMANRKEINRKAKDERVLADQIEVVDCPAAKIDEAALVSELAAAGKHNADVQLRAEKRRQMTATIALKREHADELEKQAAELIRQVNAARKDAENLEEQIKSAGNLPSAISVDDLQGKIATARATNRLVALREEKLRHERTAADLEAQSKALTERMEKREEEKRAKIAAAKLPVESITFGDGIVLLNGVPFDQASDAEQLRASCALAMAGNPQLKVIRVRDGSLLDEEGLALLGKMADERGFQVWIERVATGNVGFELIDGHLRETEKQVGQQELLA